MKLKLTLAAGIIATLAAPVAPAHAVTGNWTLLATLYGASHYACRVPVDGGSTVRSYLEGRGTEAVGGLRVYKNDRKILDSVVMKLALEQESASGELFVPAGSKYSLQEWFGLDTPETISSRSVDVSALILC